jgi:hypothetical protein
MTLFSVRVVSHPNANKELFIAQAEWCLGTLYLIAAAAGCCWCCYCSIYWATEMLQDALAVPVAPAPAGISAGRVGLRDGALKMTAVMIGAAARTCCCCVSLAWWRCW